MKRKLVIAIPVFLATAFIYIVFFFPTFESPGRVIYYSQCANCHGNQGEGTERLVPPIYNTARLKNSFESLPCLIKNGLNDSLLVEGKWYNQPMYPINLSDIEIVNLMHFLNDSLLEKPNDILLNEDWVIEQTKGCK
ncbi:MAG TPA: c-type cytochrome [Chitinophagales bacterium]